MFERFTTEARAVVVAAQTEARELSDAHIGTEHTLIALLTGDDGRLAGLLAGTPVDAPFVRAEVRRRNGTTVTPDLSFTDADDEDAAALKSIGIDLGAVRDAIRSTFGGSEMRVPQSTPKRRLFGRESSLDNGGRLPMSPRNKKVLELALREAVRLRHRAIRPEHLLLGLLREGQGLGVRILVDAGVDPTRLHDEVARSLQDRAA